MLLQFKLDCPCCRRASLAADTPLTPLALTHLSKLNLCLVQLSALYKTRAAVVRVLRLLQMLTAPQQVSLHALDENASLLSLCNFEVSDVKVVAACARWHARK